LRYSFDKYVLDTDLRELRRGEQPVLVEPQVFDVLVHLVRNRDRVVSRDDLFTAVWEGRIVSESTLTTRINAVRQAVGDSGEQQRLIKTLPRKGFRFVGTVHEESGVPAASSTQGRIPSMALPDRPSIAVLPFANMSGDPDQAYFADGMAEEIITSLSRCAWLFVISRNSSFGYRGKTIDVRQIGRELGVRYVLEGSVRRAGTRLRILGQLADATSGMQIWADRFEGDAQEVFELQDRITESVVGAIEPKLQLAEIERLRHKQAPDLDAYDLLLRAQALEYEYTEESLAQALGQLERALAIDPLYAPAMALAAYCHAVCHHQGWSKDSQRDARRGLDLAVRALEIAKDDPNVLWMGAFSVRMLGGDAHRARELLRRSIELNPNSAIALTMSAGTEVVLGNAEDALVLLQRAHRLSPRDPRAWYMAATDALAYFVAGQYEAAARAAGKALAQNPRYTSLLRITAASLARLGRTREAAEFVRAALDVEPALTLSGLRMRLKSMDARVWKDYADGLRRAGLPE
jgi:TolB-like protein/Flp pilus assembly protein TadD